ncbi:MAG: sigma-70 family RNA polymerase sigma factor, partial [Thermoanaerobaculia bacterium]
MRVPRDSELVQAVLEGNSEAFDELAERYGGKLYNAALRVTGNPEDALDATQNALLKAYDNLASFDPSYRFFSWIYRIQMNEALNLVHKRRRYVGLPSEMPAPKQATP